MTEPTVCPYCLGPWDREAVIERRAAVVAARRAEIEARTRRPKPAARRPDGPFAAWSVNLDTLKTPEA